LPGLTKDSEEPQGSSEFFVLYLNSSATNRAIG